MTTTISVVGLGYIGLPTAAVLADRGCKVIGIDVNSTTIAAINAGQIHIVEPGLDEVVARVVSRGDLHATNTPKPADAFLIAVPTPFCGDKTPDLRYVESACKAIAPVLKKGDTVILESTSPVGATEQVATWIAEARPDLGLPNNKGEHDIAVAYCPERVLPGNVLEELVINDRVIGGLTAACAEKAREVYGIFVRGACILTDARTAEMCKLTENAFRDVNIAFANELSLICDKLGINVWELIRLANRHPRVNILQPGPGVGGHCIAVDPWFIVASAPDQARLIRTAREVNDSKPEWVVRRVREEAANLLERRPTGHPVKVACLGLAFKPNIDDLRESPALEICKQLALEPDLDVIASEPNIERLPDQLEGTVKLMSARDAVRTADIVLLLVDHTEFKDVHQACGAHASLIDTRGMWDRVG